MRIKTDTENRLSNLLSVTAPDLKEVVMYAVAQAIVFNTMDNAIADSKFRTIQLVDYIGELAIINRDLLHKYINNLNGLRTSIINGGLMPNGNVDRLMNSTSFLGMFGIEEFIGKALLTNIDANFTKYKETLLTADLAIKNVLEKENTQEHVKG